MLNVASPIDAFDPEVVSYAERGDAFDRYRETPSGREKPGRYWKIDLDALALDETRIAPAGRVAFQNVPPRAIACDLQTARRRHPDSFARAFGATRVQRTRFGALTTAFAQLGAFVHVPTGVATDAPIVVSYDLPSGSLAFPYTVVLLDDGAGATIVERFTGGNDAMLFGASEAVTGNGSELIYVAPHHFAPGVRAVFTRSALPGRDAHMSWALADLGGALSVNDVDVTLHEPGARADVVSIFFPSGDEHVDVASTIDHQAGDASSETIVKSAANGRGQARFLGNIRIAKHAQGSNAALRDDAMLLSPHAHIDSVPALEIAANDVKAFHGATVGALDAEQIFYMQSRGIAANEAERMIALGFFEPAIARFPTEAVREELRDALRAKLG